MKNFKRWVFSIGASILSLLPTLAFAQTNIVSVPSTDLSKNEIIDFLFGPIVSGSSGANPIGNIIGVFNGVVLLVGGIIVAYTYLAGTLATAHEGEVLGKRWSSMWLFLRLSVGSALLIPAPGMGGFCVMQAIVVWMAIQGIGFADKMWDSFTQDPLGSGIYTPADLTQQSAALARDLLLAQVCLASIDQSNTIDQSKNSYASLINNGVSSGTTSSTPGPDSWDGTQTITLGSKGACGAINFEMPVRPQPTNVLTQSMGGNDAVMNQANEIDYNISKYQWQQTQLLFNNLKGLATEIVSSSPPTTASVSSQMDNYVNTYATNLQNYGKQQYQSLYQSYSNTNSMGNPQGWISAGAYYMQISRLMNAVSGSSGNFATVLPPPAQGKIDAEKSTQNHIKVDCGWWSSAACKQYANHIVKSSMTAINLMSEASTMKSLPGPQIGSGADDKNSAGLLTRLTAAFSQNIGFVMTKSSDTVLQSANTNTDTDPIVFAQNLGNSIENAAYISTVSILPILALGYFFPSIGGMLGNMALMGFKAMLIAGISLSVVLPMLPFMIWLGAVLGWIVLLVEATIGAPLLCLSIIAPDGDGIVGRAGQGYMMILSLTLKPVLMILGFIASVVLMKPLGHLINVMFFEAFNIAVGQSASGVGITNSVAGMFLYAAVMLGLVKKVFDLIHVIPDTVLRWMGAPGGQELGSSARAGADAERQALGAIAGVAGGAQALGSSMQRGLTGGLDNMKKAREDGVARLKRNMDEKRNQATENRKTDEQQAHMAMMSKDPRALEEALLSSTQSNMGEAQNWGVSSDTRSGKSVYQGSGIPAVNAIPSGIPGFNDSGKGFAQKREALDNLLQEARKSGNPAAISAAKNRLDAFDNKAMDVMKDYTNKNTDAGLGYSDRRISEAAQARDGMFQARQERFSGESGRHLKSAQTSIEAAINADSSIASQAQQAGGIEKLMGSIPSDPSARSEAQNHLAAAQQSLKAARESDGLAAGASSSQLTAPQGYTSSIKLDEPKLPDPEGGQNVRD